MVGRPTIGDGDQPLFIELLDDSGDGGEDVSFGRRTPGPTRHRLLVGAAAVAGLLLVIVALSLGGDEESAAPQTSTTVARTTTTPAPSTTQARPRRSTTTAVTMAYVPIAPFATDPGWDVYVIDYNNGLLQAFDPTTGEIERLSGERNVFAVYSTLDGPLMARWDNSGQVSYLADGSRWVLEGRSLIHRGAGVNAVTIGEIVLIDESLGWSVQLIGTTATGEPVLLLPDSRPYVAHSDGSLSRFGDFSTYLVSMGQFAEQRCMENGQCATFLHGAAGTLELPVALGYAGSTAFSPAGTHAAVVEWSPSSGSVTGLTIYDLRTGQSTTVAEVNESVIWGGVLSGWSPDGAWFFVGAGGGLRAVESATGQTYDLPIDGPSAISVIGVA